MDKIYILIIHEETAIEERFCCKSFENAFEMALKHKRVQDFIKFCLEEGEKYEELVLEMRNNCGADEIFRIYEYNLY